MQRTPPPPAPSVAPSLAQTAIPPPKGHAAQVAQLLNDVGPNAVARRQALQKQFFQICMSDVGVAIASILVFFLFLLFAKPAWTLRKDRTNPNSKSMRDLNWGLVIGVSLIGGLLVFFAPFIVRKTQIPIVGS